MNIKKIYPPAPKKKVRRAAIIKVARWPFVIAALSCLIVDFLIGDFDWSLIAVVSLYIVWTVFISPAMVEVNPISQMIKVAALICLLLFVISRAVPWKGSTDVISIICSSVMGISFALLVSDYQNQKNNVFPMIVLCLVSLAFSIPLFMSREGAGRWFYGVSGIIGVAVFIASVIILGGSFFRELKKRFHTK